VYNSGTFESDSLALRHGATPFLVASRSQVVLGLRFRSNPLQNPAAIHRILRSIVRAHPRMLQTPRRITLNDKLRFTRVKNGQYAENRRLDRGVGQDNERGVRAFKGAVAA
jgi:hypothetical protein